jgi:hypothetical protein
LLNGRADAGILKDTVFWFAGALLAGSLLFGGATRQGLVSEAIPELLSLPLLALALPRALPLLKRSPSAIALMAGVVVLPCIQLVPLPPGLWTALPGRDFVAEIFTSAGAPLTWRPISLIPSETLRALLSLLPALAIFLATLALERQKRQLLLLFALVIGAASALLAMLQVLGGPKSGLYFYSITNVGRGVGLFANANHFGAFEYVLLPLGAAAMADMRTRSSAFLLVALGVVLPALLFGLALSGSRSAIALGAASIAATIPLLLGRDLKGLGRSRALAFAAGLALALVPLMMGLGMLEIMTRFTEHDVAEDARWAVAASTWEGIRSYLPFGAGIGTFPSVYPLHERAVDLIPQFVNRAHDDGLETLFEGGIGSLALLVGFIIWLSLATRRAIAVDPTYGGQELPKRQARAGVIVMWLLLLHSIWDYPLRTLALGVVFALCAALQFAPPPSAEDRRGRTPKFKRLRTHGRPVGDLARVN